jgi:uncharacterized protein with HEPN domain
LRDDSERLRDILEAIERIERHAVRGRDVFVNDELVQTWIVHQLQIIGEAARHLSRGFRKRHTDPLWAQIIAMRHILVHEYFALDAEAVWAMVERDIPTIKRRVESVLRELLIE